MPSRSPSRETRALILEKGLEMFREAGSKQRQYVISRSLQSGHRRDLLLFPEQGSHRRGRITTTFSNARSKVRELVLGTTDLRERLGLLSIRNWTF